jgi:hypothetical protein
MADSKVSELTAATTVGGSDLLYLVQSNTSKRITAANFFANAGNVIPSANSVYNLGSPTNQWKSLYVSNNTIYIGGTPLTVINGQLVIGSGGSSANLATVAYVNSAVANVGGGNVSNLVNGAYTVSLGSTGTLTVPGPIKGLGNSKLDFTTLGANTVYLTTTSDDTTALNMGAAVAELYAQTSISIRTNTDETAKVWLFGDDGTLTFPDSSVQSNAAISVAVLKALVANAATYAAFQTAIANL